MASNSAYNKASGRDRPVTYGSASRKQQAHPRRPEQSLSRPEQINGAGSGFNKRLQAFTPTTKRMLHSTYQGQATSPANNATALDDPYDFSSQVPGDQEHVPVRKRKHSLAFKDNSAPAKQSTGSDKSDQQHKGPSSSSGKPKSSIYDFEEPKGDDSIGGKLLKQPAATSQTHQPISQPGRRRLIDTLAAQRPKTPESDSESDEDDARTSRSGMEEDSLKALLSPRAPASHSQTPERRVAFTKSKKIKVTYSQSRVTIATRQKPDDFTQSDNTAEATPTLSDTDIFSAPPSPPAFDEYDDDDDQPSKVGIQSVHELRRAGANNRFSDEMDDILARVGVPSSPPSSMRRNALCEVAQKLQRKDFANQFRDHAARDKIVKNIEDEHDVVSGFALVAVLVIFISSGPAPHLLRQLATERIGKLLSRLLALPEDIADIAARKETNVPRSTRTSLIGIKYLLLKLPIWHQHTLTEISPRSLSLQLLDIIGRCSEPRQLEEITHDVAGAMDSVSDHEARDGLEDDIDYILTISALEAQSILIPVRNGLQSQSACQFLSRTLQHWPRQSHKSLDSIVLKLSINMTNNTNSALSFSDTPMIFSLAKAIFDGLNVVKAAVDSDQLQTEVYDELLLLLGILINLLEHCPEVRTSVDEKSLERLTSIWATNMASVNEVGNVGD